MKKRRYRDFAVRSSTNDDETTEGNRRPYSGRVSGSDQTENLARREYYEDGDTDRRPLKPPQTHLSGDLRQCESLSMKFQWNNLLAQNPNPGFNPRVLTRPEFDYSNILDYEIGYEGRGLAVDQIKQYGGFDHGGYTSPLPKSNLGFQENVENRRPISYRALEEETSLTSGSGYSSMAVKEGFHHVRDEYERSRAMAEMPIGHGGCARGHMPIFNELVDYGVSSIANEGFGFGGEFIRSREMVRGGCSQGQTVRHNEVVDNEVLSEALTKRFRGRSRERGHGGYCQGLTARRIEFDDNGPSEALTEGFHSRSRAMAEGPVGHAGCSQGCTPIHNHGSLPIALNESFRNSDEFTKSRAMAERPVDHAGYFQCQTTRQDELADNAASSEALNEGFHSRSRVRGERPVGHTEYSRGQTPIHSNGSSPIDLNEGFRASDVFTNNRTIVEGLIGHGGYSRGRSRTMAEGPVSCAGYSGGHTPRHNHRNSPIALNESFCGGDEVNKSREMAEGSVGHGGYSHDQTPRKNELVHPRWAQQSPEEEMSRDHKGPGMKRNDNGDMNALFLLDLLYKKMASVGEDPRSPSHLRPTVTDSVVQRVGGSNGSVGARTHDNCQLEQYHDYMEPTNMFPNHQSTSEPSIPHDEFSESRTEVSWNNEIHGFRLGVDVGHEREVEPLSYEGNVQTSALPDEEQGLLEAYGGCQQRLAEAKSLASMTPVKRWALKKEAMKQQQSGNHSKSMFFPDLNPSSNVLNSSYEVDISLTTTEDIQQQFANEDIQQYAAACGDDQWRMEQNLICGDDQWNIDHGVTREVDQGNIAEGSIDQVVTCGVDQRSIAQGVTSGEDQCNIHRSVISGGDQWNNDQGAIAYGEQHWGVNNGKDQRNNDKGLTTCGEQLWRMNYGEDQWNAEHINNLNSELPASMQEHFGEQSEARIHVKERLGPPKLSTGNIKTRLGPPRLSPGNIKTRLGPPMKSPGSVKMRLGPSPNDPRVNISGCKPPEQYKSRIIKIDGFSESIHPKGDVFIKVKTDAVTENIHPQKSALPQVEMDSLSKVKPAVTGSSHPHGKTLPNVKKGDCSGSICPEGDSHSKVNVEAAKKEPSEDSKEFKQLIDDAFIKFIKILIENPAQRRQFMEGRGGKCCVCASNNEFVETETIARHAFSSPKIGYRAEHLGFHKALCVLLGWDSAAVLNGRWVQQKLPDAKALALKEDLVIWPPVVVIHNSSLVNEKPEGGRQMVMVEGMGLVGGKTNVYCGEPADGSVMVVKFKPTYSGLQEAERLHKLFADNKHGKAEWRNTSSVRLSNSSDAKQDLERDEGNCPYGYLGNADDYDLLDLRTKKHFGVKSKKQIKAIANASL
ncbi:hypothetical protein ACLB2K_029548 [Fragaria x ananassa]